MGDVVEIDYENELEADHHNSDHMGGSSGWGVEKTPRPTATYLRTPKPTKEPKTTRPTVWKAPKTTKMKTTKVKTTKEKTPRPTRVMTKTPKPTKMKTTKVKSTKTPRPTVWKAPKTTKEPRTPRPTATYLRTTRATYMQPNPVSGCGQYL